MSQKPEYEFKDLKFEFDLSKTNYQLDALQNKLLQFYLRADRRFRQAFSQNYTSEFLKYLQDKARLREPIHLSILGATRGGKSYTAITIATFLMACYGKIFTIDYICANVYEFLEKLKTMPEEKLLNSCFVIDEEKQAIYGVGSVAKKMKITDVQNIIAVNNISTIMLNPISWSNKNANYGIRLFGRCFETFTTRSMLYNLQAGGKQSELPMGNIYLPIFTHFIPKPYVLTLEKQYMEKKREWVRGEMRGEGDVLYEIKKKSAESFIRDEKYMGLKKKAEKLTYIAMKLGSEWTRTEIDEIYQITRLLEQGIV